MRRCTCDRCDKGWPYKPGDCRICWLYHNDARYRNLYDGLPQPEKPVKAAKKPRSPYVSSTVFGQRLEICQDCDQYDNDQCRQGPECVSRLAMEHTGTCPLGKWPKEGPA